MKNISINPEDYTILAVDDIATNIMLLKAVLSRAKYKIVTASGGNEALEKAATELPDLILLDIMMPDMDGYEVIRHLKADPALQDIPVIFLTALHNPEDIVKGFKLGASDYVTTSIWRRRSARSCSSATNCRPRSTPATRCTR